VTVVLGARHIDLVHAGMMKFSITQAVEMRANRSSDLFSQMSLTSAKPTRLGLLDLTPL
jgi:hypothetical protein